MSTDAELLATWRAGDRRAGRALFDRHFESIHRFFHNKVANAVDDLVQQTFLACTESHHTFRAEASFRSWLFGIAHNVLRMHLRKHHGVEDLSLVSVCDLGPSPASIVAAREDERLLLEALRRIPLDYQVALELFFWEEMSGSEIANALGVPEGTVRTRIRRGRIALEEHVRALASSPAAATSTCERLDAWAHAIRARLGIDSPGPRNVTEDADARPAGADRAR